jgi:hypothetical protein
VTTRHQRFALHDVTFNGTAMPGATIDEWRDVAGNDQWSARLVARLGPVLDEGELMGLTADGRLVSGHALVADRQVGPGGRRDLLIVFHGSGTLTARFAAEPGADPVSSGTSV